MVGPRVTVRVTQLVRSISTSPATAVPKTANLGTIITSSKAAAPLSRKYADLLREKNIEWDVSKPFVSLGRLAWHTGQTYDNLAILSPAGTTPYQTTPVNHILTNTASSRRIPAP